MPLTRRSSGGAKFRLRRSAFVNQVSRGVGLAERVSLQPMKGTGCEILDETLKHARLERHLDCF